MVHALLSYSQMHTGSNISILYLLIASMCYLMHVNPFTVTAKIGNLKDYHRSLLRSVTPLPSGMDIANTLKYFSQTLLRWDPQLCQWEENFLPSLHLQCNIMLTFQCFEGCSFHSIWNLWSPSKRQRPPLNVPQLELLRALRSCSKHHWCCA